MYMNKYFLILIILAVHFFVSLSIANASVWEVSLFFDGQILREDNQAPSVIREVSGRTLSNADLPDQDTGYSIAISSDNTEMYRQSVAVPQANRAMSVEIPYMSMADTIQVYSQDIVTATIDVSNQRTCFPNNVCEFERGENEQTCPSDCLFPEVVQYSSETQQTLASQNGVIRDQEGTVLIELREESDTPTGPTSEVTPPRSNIFPLIGGVILILGAIGYLVYSKVRKR